MSILMPTNAELTPDEVTQALRQLQEDSHNPEYAWTYQGNCYGAGSNLFFPERGASTKEAKAVCQGCVVREECLETALSHPEHWGIWGGLSERQRLRVRLRRAHARAASKSTAVTTSRP